MKLVTQNERAFLDANANSPSTVIQGTIVTANKAADQAASVAADVAGLLVDFNALLAKLKAAGIML